MISADLGPDPFAWMHDSSSREFADHLAAERAAYDASVAHLVPLVSVIRAEATARVPAATRSAGVRRTRFSYYTDYPAGRDYPQLIRQPHAAGDDEMRILLDFQSHATGDYLDWAYAQLSPDETRLAFALDNEGDEVFQLRFLDAKTGQELSEVIPRCYYGGAWTADSRAFLYTVHDDAYRPFQVWLHHLGRPDSEDELILEEPDEAFEINVRSCRSGQGIIAWSESNSTSECWWIDPTDPSAAPRSIGGRRHGVRYHAEHRLGHPGTDLLIVTDEATVEGRLMAAPLPPTEGQGFVAWRQLRRERSDQRLYRVDAFADGVVASIRADGRHQLLVLPHNDLDTDNPGVRVASVHVGSDVYLSATPQYDAPAIAVLDEARTHPADVKEIDLATGRETVVWTEPAPGYDPSRYLVSRHTFPSPDGTLVPATLYRHRDTPLDGTAPCLLYGYGAYEAVFEPEWEPALPSLLDRGVVYVFAHIRGGGEGGRRWYLDGKMAAKQHTFDDHIAVADGLALDGLVDPSRIATRGLSAGGLLQGAVFSQRPDRWAAVVAEVPFVDVVTSMSDPNTPLTITEWEEWGDPRIPEQRAWMSAYDPYQNLPPAGVRPPLLVTGAVHDPRVMVREPAKWTAALRASDPDWAPQCVFRVETGAGSHTGPSGRFGHLEYEAEIYAWVLDKLGVHR